MLHVTNGDSAAGSIRKGGIPGQVIPWRDVLHEGPVPAGLTLEEMSEVRARFLSGCGWGPFDETLLGFRRRDEALSSFGDHEELVLWFEHDLYDQLQVIQILDWLADKAPGGTALSMICIGEHPAVVPFHGLGQLNVEQMAELFPSRAAISRPQLELARRAWTAFCSPDPTALREVLKDDTSPLPFLEGSLSRHLEQFPSVTNGLSRSENQILAAVAAGTHRLGSVFSASTTEMEEQPFMGDATLAYYLERLSQADAPALKLTSGEPICAPRGMDHDEGFWKQEAHLTPEGQDFLSGRQDWVRANGIDRWLGGVHLRGKGEGWRWDPEKRVLVRQDAGD